mgnify:FL=1
MKFKYANDIEGNIIDVASLSNETLDRKISKFYTLHTNAELIPRLGKIKVKHFALKNKKDHTDNYETYLHLAGKHIIYNDLKIKLSNNIPWFLTLTEKSRCERMKSLDIFCEGKTIRNINLTEYFDDVYLESRHGDFIPDILLINRNTGAHIYIEVAVTHKSSTNKLKSNNRILEVSVANEADLNHCLRLGERDYLTNHSQYNFRLKTHSTYTCTDFCKDDNEVSALVVYESGKSYFKGIDINESFENELKDLQRNTNKIVAEHLPRGYEVFEFVYQNSLDRLVTKAREKGFSIKHCYSCRYHAKSMHSGVFCKFLKKRGSGNMAVSCEYFKEKTTDNNV